MASTLLHFAVLAFLISATAYAHDSEALAELLRRIERQDAKIAELETERAAEIGGLKVRAESAEQREAELKASVDELNKRVRSLEKKKKTLQKIRPGHEDARTTRDVGSRRELVSSYNVAFSAYLDHDTDDMDINDQTRIVKCNKILLNDGSGYNGTNGVFTVPTTGVYSFTFFIGERDDNQIVVALYVNDKNQVDAIVQTDNDFQDGQGGNSVLLKVNAGDTVYVKTTYGDHIEGSARWRYTTFSGFLLYPTEVSTASVIG